MMSEMPYFWRSVKPKRLDIDSKQAVDTVHVTDPAVNCFSVENVPFIKLTVKKKEKTMTLRECSKTEYVTRRIGSDQIQLLHLLTFSFGLKWASFFYNMLNIISKWNYPAFKF